MQQDLFIFNINYSLLFVYSVVYYLFTV